MPENNHDETQTPPPHAQLAQMATAYWVSDIVYVAAKLSLADHLAKGPRGADELADSITGQCLTGFIMSQNRSAIAVEAEKCRGSLDGRTTP